MYRRMLLISVLWLVQFAATPPNASALTVEAAIDRFFSAEELERDWFASSFLQAVAFEQLEPIRQQLTAGLGDYVGASAEDDRFMARFEEGRIPVFASIDGEGRFVGLRLLLPIPKLANLEEVGAKFEALPGEGHLLVIVDGEDRLDLRAEEAFAVGSAFKLQVLKLLLDDVEAGKLHWTQVVELDATDSTLGGGTLSTWPSGSPITLHTVALLMISESDNTATDLLIRILGRDRVSAAGPSGRNMPFLTTREAFQLKDPRNADQLESWRSGNEDERVAVLEGLKDKPIPGPDLFAEGGPVHTDVEWLFTAKELCELIGVLQELELMTVNPGVMQASDYQRVAYKGGSEPGVLNFTTWARDDQDREICVCATLNADEAIELNALAEVVTAAFEVVAGQ